MPSRLSRFRSFTIRIYDPCCSQRVRVERLSERIDIPVAVFKNQLPCILKSNDPRPFSGGCMNRHQFGFCGDQFRFSGAITERDLNHDPPPWTGLSKRRPNLGENVGNKKVIHFMH